jgi:uncharacterized protein (DUF885 family)
MSNIEGDLNATIASAVNARIEAEVMAALSGDEVIARFVTAALQQKVGDQRYGKQQRTFLAAALETAIKDATKAAVGRLIEEERPLIEDEIRKALRRNVKTMADSIVGNLADKASSAYGVRVELQLPGENR